MCAPASSWQCIHASKLTGRSQSTNHTRHLLALSRFLVRETYRSLFSIYPRLFTNANSTQHQDPPRLTPTVISLSTKKDFSTSLPRGHTSSILIKVHPTRPATKLRCVSITGHSTVIWTVRGNGRRLDTFSVAVATAITSVQKKPSASFFHQGSKFAILRSATYSEPNSTPIYLYAAQ